MAARRFPREGLDAGDDETQWSTIWRAQNVEIRTFGAHIPGADRPVLAHVPAHCHVPRLNHPERVISIDAPIVRRSRGRGEQGVCECQGAGFGADHRLSLGERRLCDELPRDGGVRPAVVGDAVSTAHDGVCRNSISDAESWTDVVRVRVEQGGWKRARVRPDSARQHWRRSGEGRRHVEVGHLSVHLDVRERQLVAKAEIERQPGILLPVVLDEQVERTLVQVRRAADLQRR